MAHVQDFNRAAAFLVKDGVASAKQFVDSALFRFLTNRARLREAAKVSRALEEFQSKGDGSGRIVGGCAITDQTNP